MESVPTSPFVPEPPATRLISAESSGERRRTESRETASKQGAPAAGPNASDPENTDALTSLANRALFLARLRRSTAVEWCVEGLFVLLVDLEGFQEVNERFGYDAADQLLVEVAARLKKCLRPIDTVARFGADEFAILLSGLRSGDDATRIADRLQKEVALPVSLEGQEVIASASVGIAMGAAGARPEHIIRDAERALARAKLLGQHGCHLHSSELDAREAPLQRMETALRRALDQDEFRTRYRPTLLRKEGSVPGFEIVLFKRRAPGERASVPHRPRAQS